MTEIKIGDRVRVIENYHLGATGTVIRVRRMLRQGMADYVDYLVRLDAGQDANFSAAALTLLNKEDARMMEFKIGDRVKAVKGFHVGSKGTITAIGPKPNREGQSWDYMVRRDGADADVGYMRGELQLHVDKPGAAFAGFADVVDEKLLEKDLSAVEAEAHAAAAVRSLTTETDVKKLIVQKAAKLVVDDRRKSYGSPADGFERIARFWQAYFENTGRPEAKIIAADVSPLMRLLKEARLCESPNHFDSFVDIVGYALTGAEVNKVDATK